MMDLTFNIISFFVMINTFSRDEAAQRVRLPVSATAAIAEDERIPDSLAINIDRRGYLLGWGLELNLRDPAALNRLTSLLGNEAALQRERQRQRGVDARKEGLSTTLIMRVDKEVDYTLFRQVMDLCRKAGFRKFQLKASEEEPARGPAS